MFYFLRQIIQLIWSRFFCAPLRSAQETVNGTYMVWPDDIDHFLHVNNGTYNLYSEFGRVDWFVRSGRLFKSGRPPNCVLGAIALRYRRQVVLGRYKLRTRVLGIDDRDMYFETQVLLPDGKMVACFIVAKMTIVSKTDRWADLLRNADDVRALEEAYATNRIVKKLGEYETATRDLLTPKSH